MLMFLCTYLARTLGLNELYVSLFDDPLNMGSVLTSMFVWTIIYLPLTWYMEKIFPGDYGVPLPYYFPFLVNFNLLNVCLFKILKTNNFVFFLFLEILLVPSSVDIGQIERLRVSL